MASNWRIIILFAIAAIFGRAAVGHTNTTAANITTTTALNNETTMRPSTTHSTVYDLNYHFSSSSTTAEPPSPDVPVCGVKTLTDQSGDFTSPIYPKDYPNNQMCTWHIKVKKGMRIELLISNIDIEAGAECEFDVLEVFDGASTDSDKVAQICDEGGQKKSVIRSSSNKLTVTFTSDGSERFGGFKAEYTAKSCFKEKILKAKGDEKWFNFTDKPKSSKVKKALSGSGKIYSGLAKKDVTFHIEGEKKFKLVEVSIRTQFASEIKFTFHSKSKATKSGQSVKKSEKWTLTKMSHNKKIDKLSITFVWNSKLKDKKAKKINVKDLLVKACLD